MLTGSVPISYRFRDKWEFQSKMHPASKLILNFISHLTSYCHHHCHCYLLNSIHFINNNHWHAHQTLLSTTSCIVQVGAARDMGSSPNNRPLATGQGKLRHTAHYARHTSRNVTIMVAKRCNFRHFFHFFSTVILRHVWLAELFMRP